ncbi:hypothetical protein [Dietzia natronolimnaea]|nr:hypothetical protein [Dietzia natronolimnaea]
MSSLSCSASAGRTSSTACGSSVANRASSSRFGRLPPIGEGRRGMPVTTN